MTVSITPAKQGPDRHAALLAQDLNQKILTDFEEFASDVEAADARLQNLTQALAALATAVAGVEAQTAAQVRRRAMVANALLHKRYRQLFVGKRGVLLLCQRVDSSTRIKPVSPGCFSVDDTASTQPVRPNMP